MKSNTSIDGTIYQPCCECAANGLIENNMPPYCKECGFWWKPADATRILAEIDEFFEGR